MNEEAWKKMGIKATQKRVEYLVHTDNHLLQLGASVGEPTPEEQNWQQWLVGPGK